MLDPFCSISAGSNATIFALHSHHMRFAAEPSCIMQRYRRSTCGGETVSESICPESVFRTSGPEFEPRLQFEVASPMYCMPAGTAPGSDLVMLQLATPAQ